MNLTNWCYIGITILTLDIVWIVFYYYYATVKIYNFKEQINRKGKCCKLKGILPPRQNRKLAQQEYQYLGHLWVRKKRGQYILRIPQEMIDVSVTTRYKIVSESAFHKLRKGEKLYIDFADKYHTEVKISAQITVKNYIATSHQL